MTQHYSNPSRENDPFALPDLEIEWFAAGEHWLGGHEKEGEDSTEGFYYAFCFPGCLPDSDWIGPFASEEEALADAREASEL